MPTFTLKVRSKKGLYRKVFVRLCHGGTVSYIPTSLFVHEKHLTEKLDITDPAIIKKGEEQIGGYTLKMEKMSDVRKMSCQELVRVLTSTVAALPSFSEFCRGKGGRSNSPMASRLEHVGVAIRSLERFLEVSDIKFEELTRRDVQDWIDSLNGLSVAPSSYYGHLRSAWNMACQYYNDEDEGVFLIKKKPFDNIDVPPIRRTRKVFLSPERILSFFKGKTNTPLEHQSVEMCLLSFCLAGINLVDLMSITKEQKKGDFIHYERSKTKGRRPDRAEMIIQIPNELKPILRRYEIYAEGTPYWLSLAEGHRASSSSTSVSQGLRSYTARHDFNAVTYYTMRRSWATIARNDVGATMEDIALSLNHVGRFPITEIYVEKDFAIVDRLNTKVREVCFMDNVEVFAPRRILAPSLILHELVWENVRQGAHIGVFSDNEDVEALLEELTVLEPSYVFSKVDINRPSLRGYDYVVGEILPFVLLREFVEKCRMESVPCSCLINKGRLNFRDLTDYVNSTQGAFYSRSPKGVTGCSSFRWLAWSKLK